jgi:DNA repair protein RadA/Sms
VVVEGRRPLVVEIEALVVLSSFSNPRRISESLDISRLNRISAILTKFTDDNYNNYDIYVNISGGLKTNDVGIDLAICAVVYSSKNKKIIKNSDLILGEVKIRNVFRLEQRIKEAKKFGIDRFYIPNNTDIVKNNEIVQQSDIIYFIKDYFK